MNKVTTVEEYIANAPEEIRQKLRELRKAILACNPEIEEKISYSMPYYGYKGRFAYFAYAKDHIGLYIPPPIIENHANQLSKYKTAKATVQFPLDEDLPIELIKKLLRARIEWNDNSAKLQKEKAE